MKNELGELKWAAYDKNIDLGFIDEGIVVNNLTDEKYSFNLNGEWIEIKTIEIEPFKGKVYNISVEETHNYLANDILVHNIEKKVAPIN